MQSYLQNSRWLILLMMGMFYTPVSYGQDLDVESARRSYESAKRTADSAQNELDRVERRYRDYEQRYQRADRRVQNIKRDLEQARRNLQDTKNKLEQVRRDLDSDQRKLDDLQQRRRDLNSRVSNLKNKRDRQKQEVDRLKNRLDDINQKIRDAEAAGNDAQVKRLKERRKNVRSKLQTARNDLQQARQNLSQAESRLQQVKSNIDRTKRRIANLKNQQPNLRSQRDRYRAQVDRLKPDLEDARNERRQRKADMDAAFAEVSQARRYAQDRQAEADRALAYYRQVQRNYNAARDRSVAVGRDAGNSDGGSEARQRATPSGQRDGVAYAKRLGESKGSEEARKISMVKGYKEARANAASTPSLANFYQQGRSRGKRIANNKAVLEEFPRGYNQALERFLASSPANQETIDITEGISDIEGDDSTPLRLTRRDVQTGESPAFPAQNEPSYSVPGVRAPSPSVPAPNNNNFNPPCSGRELPEFDRLCRSAYADAYRSNFRSSYNSHYRRAYQNSFDSNIRSYYDSARNVSYNDETQKGLELGAKHQGILDGFANSLPGLRKVQFNAGIKKLERDIQDGYLLSFSSASVVGERDDGIISPGEKLQIQMTIRNIGRLSTPRAKLRLRITQASGVLTSTKVRALPSLRADTTTTLTGVLPAVVASEVLNNALKIQVTLEQEQSAGSFVPLTSFTINNEVNFPIELVSIDYPEGLRVEQESQAMLTFKNMTNQDFAAVPVSLNAYPASLVFDEDNQLELPATAAGESVSIAVPFKTSVIAGGNQLTQIKTTLKGVYGVASMTQAKDQTLKVNRKGSLNLCFNRGCDSPYSVPLSVVAGRSTTFRVKFDFHSNQRERGPFVVEKEAVSSPLIKPGNNSTVRATLGSWGPRNQPYVGNFIYRFPQELKGQDHWVKIRLLENGNPIHSLYAPVKVR